ncbi:MAG: carbohydrate kinase family protein [Candidatus Pacebacteria bacterium]|nr:carbohydrate kinase family protein [Candidatus Paceibacterota bacterium]
MNTQIDFLAIGDIVSEPFIKLQDAEVHCNIDEENCMLSMRFGDKIPYESAEICYAVGNSPNAAVSASRLGVSSYLMSYQGDDQIGKENLESLARDGVRTDYMQIVKGLPSNYHYVLWYDVERTILVKHTEFPYSFPTDIPEPKWIYLSSLASNSTAYHLEIAEYLKQHPSVKLAFQPGTFQMKLGIETLKDIYAHTEVFFCNYEEAQRILKTEEKDKIKLMENLRALGPKIVVMTDGIKGAYAYDGTDAWFMPVYPQEPFERTGAGDAFASTFTTALLLEKTIPEALMWAPINSMSVVLQVGAQKGLLTQAQIEEFLAKAPEDYKPKKIN